MKHGDFRNQTRRETIRTTDWASKLRLGINGENIDDGICADLDQDAQRTPKTAENSYLFGMPSIASGGMPSVAGEIFAVVKSMMHRAQSAGVRIRVEIDPRASALTAGPIGTVLFGMLRRAVDAYAIANAEGESYGESAEITLCVTSDSGLVRMHVLDGAKRRHVPSADAALGLSAATAESLGGSLEIGTVPFGEETLLSAMIPVHRLAYNNESAA